MDTRHKTQDAGRNTQYARRNSGSALILAVALTSLLAIVGVIFLLSSRVDSVATSAIADNKDLNLAVDTVIAQISESLAADVPGDPNSPQEYYDYPDADNPWLACLEPYGSSVNPRWRHITDIYERFGSVTNIAAQIKHDYQDPAEVRDSNPTDGIFTADADGDGVSDSMWVQLNGKTSNKGKPVYAAIRIVDNSAMLNVNTGYKFDPDANVGFFGVDGASQTNVNLVALSYRGATDDPDGAKLSSYRAGSESNDIYLYDARVIWQYGNPAGAYTPFDISDELKLRNRYMINHNLIASRIEELWDRGFDGPFYMPRQLGDPLDEWFLKANYSSPDPCVYDYRHIATAQNLDRIVNPNGEKMFNVNLASSVDAIADYNAVRAALDPNISDGIAAQITANLIDYVDGPGYNSLDLRYDPNNNVTVVYGAGIPRFGFEQPCIYISELAQNFVQPDPNDPNVFKSYAIELYKPYIEDLPPGPSDRSWWLTIYDTNSESAVSIQFEWTGSRYFNVLYNDTLQLIDINLAEFEAGSPSPLNGAVGVEPNVILSWPVVSGAASYDIYFGTDLLSVFNGTPNDVNVFQGNVPAPTTAFDPYGPSPLGNLDVNTIYYWRIDAIVDGDAVRGDVWRFTVNNEPGSNPLVVFDSTSVILLQRRVFDPVAGIYRYPIVDSVAVPAADINYSAWLKPVIRDPNDPNVKFEAHSFQRDITAHKPIRRFWDLDFFQINNPTIGQFNEFFVPGASPVQAHPANQTFTNVGQIGELFYRNTYAYNYGGVDVCMPDIGVTEAGLRINLALPEYQPLFNYLTVIDPFGHGQPVDEKRIKGRININTAPWFVIAQLPWVSEKIGTLNYDLARNIVAYRDKATGPAGDYFTIRPGQRGFQNIGQLNLVVDPNVSLASIDYFWRDMNDLQTYPDLTPADGAISDFEERDAIFARISNLVTVRSDVFTAYILVRIGADGPQKRVVAILDRSEVPEKPVKVIAIQQVPDPR